MLSIVPHRKIWYWCSGTLVGIAIIAMVFWRFNLGIDFTGGSLIELEFRGARPTPAALTDEVSALGAARVLVQTAGERSMLIRSESLANDVHQKITNAFRDRADERRFESIGPSIGRELARKTITGVILALVLILCYVAWMFRKAGTYASSWVYGLVTIIVMGHDVAIPTGVFAVLGHFQNVEIGAPFIAAVLTILGYSISDTIIILDRVRENVGGSRGRSFAEIVEASVRQAFARSIYTTCTTILALLAVIFFGSPSIRHFALALAIGIGVGAYSSIFIAAPLLVTWYERRSRPAVR